MKAEDIHENNLYTMKVSGNVVPVKIITIHTQEGRSYTGTLGNKTRIRGRTTYRCLNLITNRECTAKSASKFRRQITEADVALYTNQARDNAQDQRTDVMGKGVI